MKPGAKRGELEQLMQKFVPRIHVGIFHNERTQSTPLDQKLMFLSVSYYFGVFGTVCYYTKLGAKRTEQVQLCKSSYNEVAS